MADTMSHLRNMKRRFTQGNSQGDLSPAEKVDQLENTLNVFRAEVDMKLKIMQQILTTRNEQVTVQKKLLEREQTLYDTLLGHWKNTPKLAATGLSVNFSAADIIGGEENEENLSDPDYMEGDEPGPSRKKSKSSLRRQRKSGKPMPKQHKMKLQAQQDEGAGAETKGADDGTFQQEEGDNGDGTFTNTDDQDQDNEWDVELEPRSPPVQVQMKNEVEDEEDVSNFDEFSSAGPVPGIVVECSYNDDHPYRRSKEVKVKPERENKKTDKRGSTRVCSSAILHFNFLESEQKYACVHCSHKIAKRKDYFNLKRHLANAHPSVPIEYTQMSVPVKGESQE